MHIVTAQTAALPWAMKELGDPKVLGHLAPGVVLVDAFEPPIKPIFTRHRCPATVSVKLSGDFDDIAKLIKAAEPLLASLLMDSTFSVQTRILEGVSVNYKPFDINQTLSKNAQAPLDVRNPEQILSVVIAGGMGYLGVSTPKENLSNWAGGMRRFKQEDEQISRAEFKLLEALETFQIALPSSGEALDLGAAPGGWTRVLLEKGMQVTTVDPAALDPRIAAHPGVTEMRMTAQMFVNTQGMYDLMVNDMRMDASLSTRMTVVMAPRLVQGAPVVMTLKLPENSASWAREITSAKRTIERVYQIKGIRQLFHNRAEVTLYCVKL